MTPFIMNAVILKSAMVTVVLAIAVVYDLRFRRIPNWLTFSAVLVSIIFHLITGGPRGLMESLLGTAAGIALLLPFYLGGGIGAGDVKLMGAVGAALGVQGAFVAFVLTGLIGGFCSLVLLARHGLVRNTLARYWSILATLLVTRQFVSAPAPPGTVRLRFCYGAVIAVGAFSSLFIEHLT